MAEDRRENHEHKQGYAEDQKQRHAIAKQPTAPRRATNQTGFGAGLMT